MSGHGENGASQKNLRSRPTEEEVTLYTLKQCIVNLQTGFDRLEKNFETHRSEMKKKFESQAKSIKTLEKNFTEKLESEIQSLQTYIDQEIGRITSRIDTIEGKVKNIEGQQIASREFNYEETVVISNLPHKEHENLDHVINNMIRHGLKLSSVDVVKTKRLPTKNSKPGLVKLQLKSLEDKKKVLQAKQHLKQSSDFSRVYIRTSKPYAERVAEMNLKTLLSSLPNGKDFYLSGNGRLMPRSGPGPNKPPPSSPHRPQNRLTLSPHTPTDDYTFPSTPSPWLYSKSNPSEMRYSSPLQTPLMQPSIH